MTFPIVLFQDARAARHAIIVKVTEPLGNVFTYTFPLTFGDPLLT